MEPKTSGDENIKEKTPVHHVKSFRKIYLKDMAIQFSLLDAEDQLFCRDNVICNTMTFNESRLDVVDQGVDHQT